MKRIEPKNCENCDMRFECYTASEDAPIKINGVNETISFSCDSCEFFSQQDNNIDTYYNNKQKFGICTKHKLLTHIRCTCKDHKVKGKSRVSAGIIGSIWAEARSTKRARTTEFKYISAYCIGK